uniref:PGG domain-containing protein n=1 Tax=Haptolina brevifila TaxID=156173 RepID=A0A7S2GJF3_9EUKA
MTDLLSAETFELPDVEVLALIDSDSASKSNEKGMLPLHIAIANKASSAVLDKLLVVFPEAVRTQATVGTPLHWAAFCDARVAVEKLLAFFPEGARMKINNGWPPLTFAAWGNASPTTIETLLTAFPAGAAAQDNNGRLPLHILHANLFHRPPAPAVIDKLLVAFPEGAATQDKDGKLPLHFAASGPSSEEATVIDKLLAAFPDGAHVRDKDGNCPDLCRPQRLARLERVAPALAKLERLQPGALNLLMAEVPGILKAASWHELDDKGIEALTALAIGRQAAGASVECAVNDRRGGGVGGWDWLRQDNIVYFAMVAALAVMVVSSLRQGRLHR